MKNNGKRTPRQIDVMVVAESQQQRLAFSDTVRSCGFNLVDCVSKQTLQERDIPREIDIWLLDSQYDKDISVLLDKNQPDTVLIGFNQAPYLNETQLYAKWQRKLKRKLAEMLDLPQIAEFRRYEGHHRQWKFVVFLGASMGGPVAVKTFLDNLSPDLPISILLAHHFNENMIHTLPRILNRHNEWRCQVISTTQRLQPGTCLIAPITQKIICDSTGRLILTKEPWSGEYKPSISDLLKNASDVYASDLISIIFSGMGDDGSQYLDDIQVNESQIWVQDPNNSASPSQPQAVIDSGHAQFIGTPIELANKLTQYVVSNMG